MLFPLTRVTFPAKGPPHAVSRQHFMRKIDLRWFFGCLRTVVTHRQLLLQLRKLTIPSLEASSVKLLPFTLLADIRNEDAHIENSSLHVGPGLGVVLEEEDPEEVMDVGTEDEGGTRFTFRVCLGFAPRESSETPLLTIWSWGQPHVCLPTLSLCHSPCNCAEALESGCQGCQVLTLTSHR